MAEARLSEEVKTYIVQAVACFDTPSRVVEAVNQEFGVKVSRQAVEKYDPTKVAGAKIAEKWKVLFDQTRKSFIEDTSQIAIAHRSARLRSLQRMAEKAETKGNLPLAAQFLKQAAEEMGNAYTNRREYTGKDGKDLPAPVVNPIAIFALPDNGRDAPPS